MRSLKGLFALTIGGLLVTAIAVKASSPDAWKQHYQEVNASCLKVSDFRNAEPVGEIVSFSDDLGYDALLVQGNYPQPHMNNRVGKALCLFNRKTRRAYTSEVN